MTFACIRLRFHCRAGPSLFFPPGKAGNVLRGAFGMMLHETAGEPEYGRIFAPRAAGGPSGLADAPRPFVFRATPLDGLEIPPGGAFHFDAHLFDVRGDIRRRFAGAFAHWTRAEVISVEEREESVDLATAPEPAKRVRVAFVTPTEMKAGQQLVSRPEFPVLFARLRDRISTLRALYGPGPLEIDFRAMGERAARVRLAHCDLQWHSAERRSSRTGQIHPLGGFTGHSEYDGDLGEFLPYLRAGQWTGVGRQTVWGKGEICFQVCS